MNANRLPGFRAWLWSALRYFCDAVEELKKRQNEAKREKNPWVDKVGFNYEHILYDRESRERELVTRRFRELGKL